MRRSAILIAIVLAMAAGPASAVQLYCTDFENAAYGDLGGQTFGGGTWTTVQSGASVAHAWAEVIDDPTGAGEGKVARYLCEDITTQGESVDSWVAWGDKDQTGTTVTVTGEYYIETADPANLQNDYWMATVDINNEGNNQGEYWWQGNDLFNISGGAGLWGGEGGPIPLNQWFTVTRILDYTAMTYKFLVNGVPQTWDDGGTPNEDFGLDSSILGGEEIWHLLCGGSDTEPGPPWDPDSAMYVASLCVTEGALCGPGDVDCNGVVDGLDLTAVLTAWETEPGDPLWNENADLDDNDIVDGLDLTEVISNWTVASSGAPEESEAAKPGKGRGGRGGGNVRKGR